MAGAQFDLLVWSNAVLLERNLPLSFVMSRTNCLSNINKCGLKEFFLFVISLFFGTTYTIYSKILMEMKCSENNDEVSTTSTSFQKPLFLTFGVYAASLFGLVVHWCVLLFRIPFPGYDFNYYTEETTDQSTFISDSKKNLTVWTYFYLFIPMFTDFVSTLLWWVS